MGKGLGWQPLEDVERIEVTDVHRDRGCCYPVRPLTDHSPLRVPINCLLTRDRIFCRLSPKLSRCCHARGRLGTSLVRITYDLRYSTAQYTILSHPNRN